MIMVVDDEKEIRELFRDVLEARGYEVCVCEKGEDAIDLLKRRKVFAAFVDIRMPGMDGISLLKQIKSIKPDTHVIMITGYSRDGAVNEALQLGCFVCMMKPFKLRDITGVLDILECGFDVPTNLAA
jgi:DNA-binding NtrC family response regulator